jgi:hypothetical protein
VHAHEDATFDFVGKPPLGGDLAVLLRCSASGRSASGARPVHRLRRRQRLPLRTSATTSPPRSCATPPRTPAPGRDRAAADRGRRDHRRARPHRGAGARQRPEARPSSARCVRSPPPEEVGVELRRPDLGRAHHPAGARGAARLPRRRVIYISFRLEFKMAVAAIVALGPRPADHDRAVRAGRLQRLAGDGDRAADHPRVLAVRHGGGVRPGQGEHDQPRRPGLAHLRRARQRLDERGAVPLDQHLDHLAAAGRGAAADRCAGARRDHPAGPRAGAVHRHGRRRLLVAVRRRAAVRVVEGCASRRSSAGSPRPRREEPGPTAAGTAVAETPSADRLARGARPRPDHHRVRPREGKRKKRASAARSRSGASRVEAASRPTGPSDSPTCPRRPGLPEARGRLQGRHPAAARPRRVLDGVDAL